MRVICGNCGIDMYPVKIGCEIIDTRGKAADPYRIAYGDLYECRVCKAKIVTGLSEYTYEKDPGYKKILTGITAPGRPNYAYALTVYENPDAIPADKKSYRITLTDQQVRDAAEGLLEKGATVEEALADIENVGRLMRQVRDLEKKYRTEGEKENDL